MYLMAEELDRADSISEIFRVVETVILRKLGKHRPVMLGVAEMGMRGELVIGAFHPVGSTLIVLNKTPLERISKASSRRLFNAYCFHMLLHEYLHSLGMLDERDVRRMVYEISREFLGPEHPATVMSSRGVTHYFPFITYPAPGENAPNLKIEIVKDFTQQSVTYFS